MALKLETVKNWTQMWCGTIWALIFHCTSIRYHVNTFIICTLIFLQTDSSPSMSLAQLAKTANLVDANASEEDKIKAMMSQSNHQYDPIHYSKKAVGPPPANYTCFRCLKAGHYIRQCPMLMVQDKSVEAPKPVKTSKGIPQSFMVKAEPGTKGAMLTSTGEYAIPAIDAEAYAQGKKERPPFVPHEQSSSEDDSDPIPDELLCPICNDLMTDAVVIPCCGNSYCDECIRTALLDSEEHICFTCKQSDVSPDNLIANKFLRQAVNNFKNETGYTKRSRKQVQHATLPPPRPQLTRPLPSRQQDPLLANAIPSPPSVPTAAPQSQVQLPVSTPADTSTAPSSPQATAVDGQDVSTSPAPAADHHSPIHSSSQGEPPPPGEIDPEPPVRAASETTSESGSHAFHLPLIGHPPPPRLPNPPGHQSRPHHSQRGGGRQWERSYRSRGEYPPTHIQTAPPLAPAPPVYPSPSLYPPPPQPYPPPYTTGPGLIAPPPIGYQPQPIYAPGPPGLNLNAWVPPGTQPHLPHLPPSLPQPPLSKDDFYRQRHRQDKVTSKLDEFTQDFHKELMKYRNSPKRRRRSFSRSRSYSRSPFSRSYSRSRSRSRSYSYTPSRSRSRSRSHGRSYPRSPYSRRNGRSYGRSRTRSRSRSRSYGYRRSGSPRSPSSYRGPGWEGPEGAVPFRSRSRSRSPGGFRSRSPGGRKLPPRELPPYELKGRSPGGDDRWERERYRQWEKEYTDWYNKYYKDYDGQQPSMHHRGRGSRDRDRDRDRVRDRMSPLSRDYSPHGRGRRGREERGAPPHHPPSSSSSGTKSSNKVLKTKKLKKKKTGEEAEASNQSDRGDATPVRDEPMDEIPSLNTTSPVSSKPASGSASAKAPASKGSATPAKPSTKATSKTQSDKTKKDKGQKVKAKVKTESVKPKSEKVKKKTVEGVAIKKKDSSSSSSSVAKPLKTIKTKSEDALSSTTPKKEKSKSSSVRPPLLKTPPLSSQNMPLPLPSVHDGPRLGHDIRGRRDLPPSGGLLPMTHQHGLPLLHRPPSPADSRRRMGDEGRSLLGPPPGKLRRIDGLGGDVLCHPHLSHQMPLHRHPHSDRPGLLPLPGSREMGRGDADRGPIRPLMDLPMSLPQRRIKLNRDLGRKGSNDTPVSERAPSGPEKTGSTSDRSAAINLSEGDRSCSTSDGAGRKDWPASAERQGSDREQDKSSGLDRERERVSGSDRDRDRDRVSASDRDRERVSGSDRDRVSGSDRDRVSGSDRERVSGSDRDRVSGMDRDRDRVSGMDRDRDRVSGLDRDRDRDRVSASDKERLPGCDKERLPGSDKERLPGSPWI
uniref:E3 ubiquitin-protein ligase RBBP6-like n=1 Tax=Solea senegalensis TaxID=28829 RepID=UPI001CD881F5|nr:E3 ubiquitin-protein ligase RBBP6-like [Solea senegalensis]